MNSRPENEENLGEKVPEYLFSVPKGFDDMSYEDLKYFYSVIMASAGLDLTDRDNSKDKEDENTYTTILHAARDGNVDVVNANFSVLLSFNTLVEQLKTIMQADIDNHMEQHNSHPSPEYFADMKKVMERAVELRELEDCSHFAMYYQQSEYGKSIAKWRELINKTTAPAMVLLLTIKLAEMTKQAQNLQTLSNTQQATLFKRSSKEDVKRDQIQNIKTGPGM